MRVYEEDALEAAARADERLSDAAVRRDGPAPPLTGVPIGLKDLYGVAGKPVTASSGFFEEVPTQDCDAWARLSDAGMVLLGHLHTHEFAVGGTTDQVGSPWDLRRSPGGSSGGSAAALAARMTPAATGTDTAGSLRIPSACCGTSAIKPTRGSSRSRASCRSPGASTTEARWRGRSPTAFSCSTRWPAPTAGVPRARSSALPSAQAAASLEGVRVAVSPRVGEVELDPDVATGFDAALEACRRLGATLVEPRAPEEHGPIGDDFLDVLTTDLLTYHRRFDAQRDRYRDSIREWLEEGERRAVTGEAYVAAQARRRLLTGAWAAWLAEHRIDAVLEPTIPVVAPLRGDGYDHWGTDYALISLTHLWDWTGFPVAALPAGVGRSGLPVGVSLIGPAGADLRVASFAVALQSELGVPEPPPVTA